MGVPVFQNRRLGSPSAVVLGASKMTRAPIEASGISFHRRSPFVGYSRADYFDRCAHR